MSWSHLAGGWNMEWKLPSTAVARHKNVKLTGDGALVFW
jgi:hypothetical protein